MTKHERLTLIAAILGSGMAFLDGFIVNIALPTIAGNLHADYSGLQWIVDGYLLTLSALILIGGSLGDILGQKRVFQIGAIGFALTSLGCGLAPNIEILTFSRILQGIAGALLVPSSLAVINTNISPARRGKAIGLWTAFGTVFPALSPLVGALLIAYSWRLIFLLNIPLGILTIFFVNAGVKDPEHTGSGAKIDFLGAFLACAGLAATTYALIEGPSKGWHPSIIFLFWAGILSLVAFIAAERRSKSPMLPLDLFKSRNFSAANLATLAMYAALSGISFASTLYLLTALKFPPLYAGLAFFPVTVVMFSLSGKAGELCARIGPRAPMTLGPIIAAIGFLLLIRISPAHTNYLVYILPGVLFFAFGLVLTVAPLTTTVMSSVQIQHSGVASAVNNAVARFAGLLIIAVLGVIAANATITAAKHQNTALSAQAMSVVQHSVATGLNSSELQKLPAVIRNSTQAAVSDAQRSTFVYSALLCALLAISSGVLSLLFVQNPKAKP